VQQYCRILFVVEQTWVDKKKTPTIRHSITQNFCGFLRWTRRYHRPSYIYIYIYIPSLYSITSTYVYTYICLQYTSQNDHGDRQPAREFVSIFQLTHAHTQVWSTTHPFKVRRPPHWRRVYFDNNFIHYNVRGAMPIRSDRRSGQQRRQEIARVHLSHQDMHTHTHTLVRVRP